MKLPFDLGVKLFFRLLLPGFLLTLGVFPGLFAILQGLGVQAPTDVSFVLAVIGMGWLVVAADMPIYMLLEGRRFWPRFVRDLCIRSETRRLARINERIDAFYAAEEPDELRSSWLEASVDKRGFPLGPAGDRVAIYPTALGNAIAAYEQYANTRYGIETVFYWPRIWINLDKDLREELDAHQAMVDSSVYACVTAGIAGFGWAVYGLAALLPPSLFGFTAGLPTAPLCFLVSGLLAVSAYLAYRVARFGSGQYGELFMAVLDTHVHKLTDYMNVNGIADTLMELTSAPAEEGQELEPRQVSDADRFEMVRRYLQYFTVKLPDAARAVPFPSVAGALKQPPLRHDRLGEGERETPDEQDV